MRIRDAINHFRLKGLTLIELMVSMTLIVIVFSALLPQFRVMFRSLDLRQASAETLQNSRVFSEHIGRTLAQAVAITAVSLSSDNNGYIEFTGPDSNAYRYDYSNNYIRFGLTGQQQVMAGPVSSLRFTCYALSDLSTPITVPASIGYIQVDTVFTDSTGYNQGETITASVMLAKAAVVSSGELVAHYKLDETSGLTASDSSGKNLHGALLNMSGNSTEWVSAVFNNGLYMNRTGDDDVVRVLDNDLLDLSTQGTLAAWMYMTDGTSKDQGIIHKGNLSNNSDEAYYLYANRTSNNNYRLSLILRNDSQTCTLNSASPKLEMNTWRHVAGVWNAANAYLYVDGVLVASTGSAVVPRNSGGQLNLGAKLSGTHDFHGILDDVRIYSYALSAAEIQGLAVAP